MTEEGGSPPEDDLHLYPEEPGVGNLYLLAGSSTCILLLYFFITVLFSFMHRQCQFLHLLILTPGFLLSLDVAIKEKKNKNKSK